ncbi:MAG: hypothetical protein IJ632_00820 [Muribaculaceae bacterium]|nr:hypothetical protein [Muribaculaceae bacterium]
MIQNNNTNQAPLPHDRVVLVDRNGNEVSPNEKVTHPKNGIILMSGVLLECFQKESPQEDFQPDEMQLDTTGTYLSVGKKPCKPQPPSSADKERQKKLFIDNAFYLLAHRERILRDSRMFLAPVAIQSGLAYVGISGFRTPTVGVYLEWWANCSGAMQTDKKGRRSLVYHLAGSPLSGCNKCGIVREDGKTDVVQLSPFIAHWKPFVGINTRYTEAKHIYQAYTLEDVLDILHHEDDGDMDYSTAIKELFMQHEIDRLNERVDRLNEESAKWHKMYNDTLMKYNEARVSKAYADVEALQTRVDAEIELIKAQKRDLKAALKSGGLDNVTYQKKLMPLNKQIRALEMEVSECKYDIHNRFMNEGISYGMIESYMRNKKKDGKV